MYLFRKIEDVIKKASPELKRKLFFIFLILLLFNSFVWGYTFFIIHKFPVLLGLVTLAYGLGLRHAVDADHIAAIDNTTRKLMQDGQKPVGVGFFFSLGHSTIVIILSVLVSISTAFVKHHLPSFQNAGSI